MNESCRNCAAGCETFKGTALKLAERQEDQGSRGKGENGASLEFYYFGIAIPIIPSIIKAGEIWGIVPKQLEVDMSSFLDYYEIVEGIFARFKGLKRNHFGLTVWHGIMVFNAGNYF